MKKILILAVLAAIVCLGVIKVSAASKVPDPRDLIPEGFNYGFIGTVYDSASDYTYSYFLFSPDQLTYTDADMGSLYANNGYAYAILLDDGVWGDVDISYNSSTEIKGYIACTYASHDIYDPFTGQIMFYANPDYFPEPEKPILDTLYPMAEEVTPPIVNALKVLLVVGLGIMATFIGVKLVPRVIHKFF